MQRGDKSPEPSMEEILASIRKIIAEEPIGSRPGPVPAGKGGGGLSDPFAAFAPSEGGTAPGTGTSFVPDKSTRFGSDDPLADLIEESQRGGGHSSPAKGSPQSASAGPGAEPRPAESELNQRSSWLFSRPNGVPAPAGPSAPRPVAPFVPRPEPQQAPSSDTPGGAGKPLEADPFARLAPTRPLGSPLPFGRATEDASPTVPAKSRENAGGADGERAGNPGAKSGAATTGPINPPDAVEPAALKKGLQVDAEDLGPALQAAVAALPEADSTDEIETELPASPVAISALNALAQGLAASGSARKPAMAPVPAEPEAPAPAPEPPASVPAASVAPAPAPVVAPAPILAAVTASPEVAAVTAATAKEEAGGTRTLEDTVADLLRPMLREWLDSNMPRIVEKALRVEIAGSAKPVGSSDQHKP